MVGTRHHFSTSLQDPTEATSDSEEMEDEHTPPAQRRGFGLGYWLVVLGLIIYLGMRVLG